MKTFVDCVHCYLKQAVTCMTIAGISEDRQYSILFELMDDIKVLDRNRTPAQNSTEILLKVYQLINNDDPYLEAKQKSNILALELYPGLKDYLNSSNKRLNDALKIAVAGNVIDLGINRNFDINASLKNSLRVGFAKDDFRRFKEKLDQEDQVVILGDNAGEIVFDKLLAEELSAMGKKITYLVKGGPILNDATRADALQVGMDQIARVVTTGSNHLGAPLAEISEEAAGILQKAGLVISKGQANFESLEHEEIANGKVFFLLKIKCECVGITAGSKFGDIVFFTR